MVNDRGPFIDGRDLDVSERVAEIIGLKGKGVADYWVEVIPGKLVRKGNR